MEDTLQVFIAVIVIVVGCATIGAFLAFDNVTDDCENFGKFKFGTTVYICQPEAPR